MLVVYTAITGSFPNQLRPPLGPQDPKGRKVRHICFSDKPRNVGRWQVVTPVWDHDDPRRVARYHKALSHRLFPNARYTLWHDGNQQLKVNPWDLVDRYLNRDHVLASYKHPDRDCVYQELEACVKLKKDNSGVMRRQIGAYRQQGYPAHNGMIETTAVLRDNSERARKINNLWWKEIVAGSRRDQLSINYVLWRLKERHAVMAGQRDRPVYFNYFPHR